MERTGPLCKMIEETPLHLFYNCTKAKLLWDQLKEFISNETSFPSLFFPNEIKVKFNLKSFNFTLYIPRCLNINYRV